jgi:sarcosine oxidase subunit beta
MMFVIIGGGGHGLATAYYLAKEHNITNVAIIEKGWIGGGNVGRNTTIIRSNYMHDDNALFSEFGNGFMEKDEPGFKLQCYVFSKRNYQSCTL